MIVCSFSGALGDIPSKHHRNEIQALLVLKDSPRFSCFDVTPALGKTLDALEKKGMIEYGVSAYPWSKAIVTESGLAFLRVMQAAPIVKE